MGTYSVLTQGHKREIGDCSVPYRDLDDVRLAVLRRGNVDLPRLGGDLLDGAHEDVRDDGDAKEAAEKKKKMWTNIFIEEDGTTQLEGSKNGRGKWKQRVEKESGLFHILRIPQNRWRECDNA